MLILEVPQTSSIKPTVGIGPPFQAFKYMLVSLIVHFNLSVRSGFNTNCSILLLWFCVAQMSTNVVAQISITREIHQAEGKKESYYVCQHKSVVLKSRIRILSELFLHMQ